MRKLITMALLAATAMMPVAAQAQSRGELRRDRERIQEEREELRDARRYGDRRDVREERRDVREARQEYREDRRDLRDRRDYGRDDWREYRGRNRQLYQGGGYRAPFRYQTFRPGVRIGQPYFQQRYVIADPYRYRLPRATGYQRWVRHYNDVLLVDTRRGYVVDVLRGFYY